MIDLGFLFVGFVGQPVASKMGNKGDGLFSKKRMFNALNNSIRSSKFSCKNSFIVVFMFYFRDS